MNFEGDTNIQTIVRGDTFQPGSGESLLWRGLNDWVGAAGRKGSDQQLQSMTMEIIPSASYPLKNDSSLLLKILFCTDAPSSFGVHAWHGEQCLTGPIILTPQNLYTRTWLTVWPRNGNVGMSVPCEGELTCSFLQCNLEVASRLALWLEGPIPSLTKYLESNKCSWFSLNAALLASGFL